MKKIYFIVTLCTVVLITGVFFVVRGIKPNKTNVATITPPVQSTHVTTPAPVVSPQKPVIVPPVQVPETPDEDRLYRVHIMKTVDAKKELTAVVGEDNVVTLLKVNRIDLANIKVGAKVIIPTVFDEVVLSPFPVEYVEAESIPKLLVISQRVQAFGVYEKGVLVRWGPISSGKKSTPTANKLYSTNWKGKEVKSSFDDEWVLKYNFNIDNKNGIGFHQYEMPGYPASHSCVRLLLEDAMWLYEWADQWILAGDGNTRLAHGTPVIVFGDYGFGKTAPWKLLTENPDATKVSTDELNAELSKYMDTINQRQLERDAVLVAKQ